jgi:ParB-like chromosome segregation protein Spo0J
MTVTAQRYEPETDLSTLKDHPRNPRQGSDEAVGNSISSTGFYGAIIAQVGTNFILAGHTRRRVLRDKGTKTAPVIWLDCDEQTALKVLLADNRTAELASWDESALLALLSEMPDLSAIGFTAYDLEALTRNVEPLEIDPSVSDEKDIAPKMSQCPSCGFEWIA